MVKRGLFLLGQEATMSIRTLLLTPAEKKFLDDTIAARELLLGKPLKGTRRTYVLNLAYEQIRSQRLADSAKNHRAAEHNAAQYSWSRPTPPRR